MSFSSERKEEIIAHQYKSQCCRKALLYGVLIAKGSASDDVVTIALESRETINYISGLIKEMFNKEPELHIPPKGGRAKFLNFKSSACARHIAQLESENAVLYNEKCSGCKAAFLSGIFLASGRVVNPEKRYRLEFAPLFRRERIKNFFLEQEMPLSEADRRGEKILYSGNSSVSEDFFAAIGLNSTAFLLMNSKIVNEFKNSANRIRNCETNNIEKTVSASARWVAAIEELEKANLLSSLPEELEKTARLRLEYKDYSLSRLAAEFSPPISKPGLSHRLNRIVEIAESLLRKSK
jgi:DNA-binding protein WhiA